MPDQVPAAAVPAMRPSPITSVPVAVSSARTGSLRDDLCRVTGSSRKQGMSPGPGTHGNLGATRLPGKIFGKA
ncbi:hypothetical protein GCM10023317_76650 [Actinopolymorpha pittospori]